MTDVRASAARAARVGCRGARLLCLLLLAAPLSAQDLDPRAYAHVLLRVADGLGPAARARPVVSWTSIPMRGHA